jgi:hypothetical protein
MSRLERTIFTAACLRGLATCENHTIPKTDSIESIEADPMIADFSIDTLEIKALQETKKFEATQAANRAE